MDDETMIRFHWVNLGQKIGEHQKKTKMENSVKLGNHWMKRSAERRATAAVVGRPLAARRGRRRGVDSARRQRKQATLAEISNRSLSFG